MDTKNGRNLLIISEIYFNRIDAEEMEKKDDSNGILFRNESFYFNMT